MRVLVTGGAGYIGAVLCRRLVERGHVPVVLDRFFWGFEPLAGLDPQTIVGDVREWRDEWLEGIDAVVHLAGLSNDPTAEYNFEANWQMNAVASDTLIAACKRLGVERLIYASSASIYDTEQSSQELDRSPVMCDETTEVRPRGAYSSRSATARRRSSKRPTAGSRRSSCARARSTDIARGCASTWSSTPSSKTPS